MSSPDLRRTENLANGESESLWHMKCGCRMRNIFYNSMFNIFWLAYVDTVFNFKEMGSQNLGWERKIPIFWTATFWRIAAEKQRQS